MTTMLERYDNTMRFDTDSAPIGADDRCLGCTSRVINDFEGPLIDSGRTMKGFGGSRTKTAKSGATVWKWLDDEGKE